jgi:predicted RNA binding protein YcfA (HicA-like mRNA interferase family)
MRAISGKEFARVLERHDWILRRIKGSHHIFSKPGSPVRLSVPVHGNRPMKIGLLKHLMDLAGLGESDLSPR